MMKDLTRFPFVFFPDKLYQRSQELQALYGDAESPFLEPPLNLLSSLLKRIRKTPYSRMDSLSQQLSTEELDLITKPYPFINLNEPVLVRKITHILLKRYTPDVGRQVWNYYQHDIEHKQVFSLVRYAFQVQEPELRFDEYEPKSWNTLSQAMSQIDPIQHLAQRLVDSKQAIRKTLQSWKIQPKSLLEQTLLYTMMHLGLSNDRWIKRYKERQLIQQMKSLSLDQLKSLIQVYVQSRNAHTFYAEHLMDFFLNQLGDPQKKERNWRFLDVQALGEIKRYYMKTQIKNFFAKDHGSNRFQFWEKYLDQVTIYELHRNPSVLFLSFPNFVVVEFADKGNAAYIYHPDGFEQIVRPRYKKAPKSKKEYFLKELTTHSEEGIPIFINRISHKGSWKKRMSEFVEGCLER